MPEVAARSAAAPTDKSFRPFPSTKAWAAKATRSCPLLPRTIKARVARRQQRGDESMNLHTTKERKGRSVTWPKFEEPAATLLFISSQYDPRSKPRLDFEFCAVRPEPVGTEQSRARSTERRHSPELRPRGADDSPDERRHVCGRLVKGEEREI